MGEGPERQPSLPQRAHRNALIPLAALMASAISQREVNIRQLTGVAGYAGTIAAAKREGGSAEDAARRLGEAKASAQHLVAALDALPPGRPGGGAPSVPCWVKRDGHGAR